MGEFNLDDHYIYYCGPGSLRRNGVAIIVNKRAQYLEAFSVYVQGKPFNIMVIQVYAQISNAEVQQFYEELQDLSELTTKKDVLFIIGDWNAKV